jgi:ankyrin repeat protein
LRRGALLRRIGLTILFVLLLGCATAIALAWGIVLRSELYSLDPDRAINGWAGQCVRAPGLVHIRGFAHWAGESRWCGPWTGDEWSRPLPWWSRLTRPPSAPDQEVIEVGAGRPLLCVRWRAEAFGLGGIEQLHYRHGGAVMGVRPGTAADERPTYLPLKPIWSGLLADACLYAAAWLVVLCVPWGFRRVRDRRRRRRERCGRCGYSLRGITSERCPECGSDRTWRAPLVSPPFIAVAGLLSAASIVALVGFAIVFDATYDIPSIHRAAWEGDLQVVRREIEHGVNLELPLPHEEFHRAVTPLWLAASNGHDSIVRVLLESGADVQGADDMGFTALMVAAENGHADVVRRLIAAGADVDAKSENYFSTTALHVAAKQGHAPVVRLLLDAGAAIERPRGVLTGPCLYGHVEVVDLLLDAGAPLDDRPPEFGLSEWWPGQGRPLGAAAYSGEVSIMRRLIERGAFVDWAEVHSALAGGHIEALELLLEHGADTILREDFDRSPFRYVSCAPKARPVWEKLIELGFDPLAPDGDDPSLLYDVMLLCDEPHEAMARFLLDGGARPDADTFISVALLSPLDDLKLLLQYDIDVDIAPDDGVTSLMILVKEGDNDWGLERIRLLLEHGADPTAVDRDGRSVLDYATGKAQKMIERAIREQRASPGPG